MELQRGGYFGIRFFSGPVNIPCLPGTHLLKCFHVEGIKFYSLGLCFMMGIHKVGWWEGRGVKDDNREIYLNVYD